MTAGRKPTFSFIPAIQLKKPDTKIQVSFNAQTQFLSFVRRNNPIVDSYVGKWIQLYADTEKKVLAWTFAPEEFHRAEELKGYTQIKETKAGDSMLVRIYLPRQLIQALKMNKNFKRQEVKTYEPTAMLDRNKLYHYIEV